MTASPGPKSTAETIALWADQLRDISACGLTYAENVYDRQRYETLQEIALEMLAYATGQPLETLAPLKTTVFSRMSPVVAGAAAVINPAGKILLMRRTDNHLWVMPGGQMEVGETPAEAVVRETYEETGIRCVARALTGVYDSRVWDPGASQQVYKFTFLCEPLSEQADPISHTNETLETAWFDEDNLPGDLYQGHVQRIADAYRVWRGGGRAHFD